MIDSSDHHHCNGKRDTELHNIVTLIVVLCIQMWMSAVWDITLVIALIDASMLMVHITALACLAITSLIMANPVWVCYMLL